MAQQPTILSASGTYTLEGASNRTTQGSLVIVDGTSWSGSITLKVNTAYPTETQSLSNIGYRNRTTGAAASAGTAITAFGVYEVLGSFQDLVAVYTHTSGQATVTVVPMPVFRDYPSSGTGTAEFDTILVTNQIASPLGIGTAAVSQIGLRIGGAISAVTNAVGIRVGPTLTATANSDTLTGITVANTFSAGAFTGVNGVGLTVGAFSVAGFTSPGDPKGINVGIVTGTGATNAYGVLVAPPTGATNNYLISHTTPATFNVKDDGTITTNSGLSANGSSYIHIGTTIPAGGTQNVGYRFSSTSSFGVFFGSGAPTLTAAQGSLYLRSDGSSTSTRVYVNTNGTTGWTNITTAT